jgi:glycosyltransferase involved in cell wall biosynthesis
MLWKTLCSFTNNGWSLSEAKLSMPDLLLLAPAPPPYGGVAIHVLRLVECLEKAGIRTSWTSTAVSASSLLRSVPRSVFSANAVHLHADEGNWKLIVLVAVVTALRRIPFVVTLHSFRPRTAFLDGMGHTILRWALARSAVTIAVSDDTASAVHATFPSCTAAVVPSALPISHAERSATASHLPVAWQGASVRLVANAGRVVSYEGRDLYGLDTIIDAMALLSDSDIHILLAIGTVVDAALWDRLRTAASADPRLHFVTLDGPLLPAVVASHGVLRTTRTEGGASLTLSEALEVGRYAIGSDCVPRPDGTILVPMGDPAALAAAITEVARRIRAGEPGPLASPPADAFRGLLEAYSRMGIRPSL